MGSGEDRETAVRRERSNRRPRARGSADGEGSSLGEPSVLPDLQGVIPTWRLALLPLSITCIPATSQRRAGEEGTMPRESKAPRCGGAAPQ